MKSGLFEYSEIRKRMDQLGLGRPGEGPAPNRERDPGEVQSDYVWQPSADPVDQMIDRGDW